MDVALAADAGSGVNSTRRRLCQATKKPHLNLGGAPCSHASPHFGWVLPNALLALAVAFGLSVSNYRLGMINAAMAAILLLIIRAKGRR